VTNIGKTLGCAKLDDVRDGYAQEDAPVRGSNVDPSGEVDQPLPHFVAEDGTNALDRLRTRRVKVWKFKTVCVLRDAGMIVNVEVEARQTI
jgi:hypothetical protein